MDSLSKLKSFRNDTKTQSIKKPKLKHKKKTQKPSYETYKDLPPSIKPGLNLLFIGFNPGLKSSELQHHYAHPTNLFWKLFNEARTLEKSLKQQGLDIDKDDRLLADILQKAKPIHDNQLVDYNIGFSDLVLRCTKTAQELTMEEKLENVPRLIQEFEYSKVEKVVIIGKGIWEVFIKYIQKGSLKDFEWGLQPKEITEHFAQNKIYVFPSTSGLVTSVSYKERLDLWNQLFEGI